MTSRVMICDASYHDNSIEKAVIEIFDTFPRDWKGLKVLVKPNILAPRDFEKGITTHPDLVRAVVRQLIKEGAEVIVGDNPGVKGYGKVVEAAKVTGIYDASEGCFENIAQRPVAYKIESKYFNTVSVSSEIFEVDVIVNLPKMKTHGLTYITGAIKNTFGYVTGGNKMLVHSLAPSPVKFAEAMLDIYSIRPPELSIMDAVTSMEGNGPANGTLRHPGKILASDNAVSLDAVFLHMIGQKNAAVPIVDIAGQRGLGETDVAKIDICGELIQLDNYKMPTTFIPGLMGLVLNRMLSAKISCLPVIDESSCQVCGICINHCPVEAMTIKNKFPNVNKKLCIKCYCCQEMCPDDAIRLEGRLLNMIRRT